MAPGARSWSATTRAGASRGGVEAWASRLGTLLAAAFEAPGLERLAPSGPRCARMALPARGVSTMKRSEIDAIPLAGAIAFRERAVEPERSALLVVDLAEGRVQRRQVPGRARARLPVEAHPGGRDPEGPAPHRRLPAGRRGGHLHRRRVPHPRRARPQPRLQDLRDLRGQGLLGGGGHRRAAPGPQRHRHPQDLVEPVQLPPTSSTCCATSASST